VCVHVCVCVAVLGHEFRTSHLLYDLSHIPTSIVFSLFFG
jgi:hypothetical protein